MTTDIGLGEQTLEFRVSRLAESRKLTATLAEQVKAARERWDLDNVDLLKALKSAQDYQAQDEAACRAQALVLYGETGEKDLGWGVKIRMGTLLTYDPKTALGWALEHRIALELNKKAFENIAKTQPLDFVNSHEEPVATIAQDLEAALKGKP